MASASTKAATAKSSLAPSMTLKGHGDWIGFISYFSDGERMISRSRDKTVRQWDLKEGKEIEEVRAVCEEEILAVAVSSDSRWVVTGGRDLADRAAELKVCEVEMGIVKKLHGHSGWINCIDISADNTLLASGSDDKTVRIWNLETGKLVAGPLESVDWVGAVRFSTDSKKLAVELWAGKCLEVWDIQSQKLVKRIGNESEHGVPRCAPIFWTNKNKNILAAFNFTKGYGAKTIYEFDASTLETAGAPFEGHTDYVSGLALSFDGALLASSSYHDDTIKLWAFESRQLLASFDVQYPSNLILSPDSRKLAYTTYTRGDGNKICICDTPSNVLARARDIARKKANLLHSHATHHPPAGHRRPPISAIPIVPRPPSSNNSQQPSFLRLSKFLHFSRMNAVPARRIQPRDPLDVPATSPLPSSVSAQPETRFDQFEIGSPPLPSNRIVQSLRQHFTFLVPSHNHGPPVVEVAPGCKFTRLAAAKLPEYKKVDDTRHPSSQQGAVPQENDTADVDSLPDVHWCQAFLCYYSCLSHGRLRMPPRWRLERIDIPRQDGAANSNSGGARSRS